MKLPELNSEQHNRSLRRAQAEWNIEYSAEGGSKGGIARAAQALAPRVAQSFLK